MLVHQRVSKINHENLVAPASGTHWVMVMPWLRWALLMVLPCSGLVSGWLVVGIMGMWPCEPWKTQGFFCKRHGILLGELPWFGILLGQICPKRFVAATRDPHAPAVIAMVGDESHELQCLHLDHYPGNCPVNIMKGACYSCLATSSRTARGQTSGFLLGWGDTDHMKSLAGRVWPTKNHWGAAAEVHKVYLVYFLGTHSSKVHKQVPTGPACQMAFPLAATAVASNCPRRPWWWGTAAQGPGWANVDGHCWAACRVCWGLAVPSGKLT